MYHSSLENPRVWIYTDRLDRVQEDLRVKIADTTLRIKIYEIENAELMEKLKQ